MGDRLWEDGERKREQKMDTRERERDGGENAVRSLRQIETKQSSKKNQKVKRTFAC